MSLVLTQNPIMSSGIEIIKLWDTNHLHLRKDFLKVSVDCPDRLFYLFQTLDF